MQDKIRILVFQANPPDTRLIDTAAELKVIQDVTERSGFEPDTVASATKADLFNKLQKFRPHILHVSCHGSEATGALILNSNNQGDGKLFAVDFAAMLATYQKDAIDQGAPPLRLVVLAGCWTAVAAEKAALHVDCAVGFGGKIDDDAVNKHFTPEFYRALVNRSSIEVAIDAARIRLRASAYVGEAEYLRIVPRTGVAPSMQKPCEWAGASTQPTPIEQENAPLQVARDQSRIADRLQGERATRQTGAIQQRRRRYKIDSDKLLVEFDLTQTVNTFTCQVSEAALPDVYSFAMYLDETFVSRTLLPRLCKEMHRLYGRQVEIRDVSIFRSDWVDGPLSCVAAIERRLDKATLEELLCRPQDNLVLAIFNRDLPLADLEQFVAQFLADVKSAFCASLQANNAYFIVVWVNVAGGHLSVNGVTTLPDPELRREVALGWLRSQLEASKVDGDVIEQCARRLQQEIDRHNAWPPRVFDAMYAIMRDLQQGRM